MDFIGEIRLLFQNQKFFFYEDMRIIRRQILEIQKIFWEIQLYRGYNKVEYAF